MQIAILGTGSVGNTIGTKLIELGHSVRMGSRTSNNEKAAAFVQKSGSQASQGTFNDAAQFGEIIFNCTKGDSSLQAFAQIEKSNLDGKIIIDVANPLDNSQGNPPSLMISNTNSLGEEIQKALPDSLVVKTLNTMWAGLMVNPRMLKETHTVFICGNNENAKTTVKGILNEFGWLNEEILDLGDITCARGTESYLPLWLRVWMSTKNGAFNIKIVS